MGTARSNGDPRYHAERERLAASITDTRRELSRTFGELRGVVREQLQWREWVKARPLLSAGLVLAVGWRLGRGRWI